MTKTSKPELLTFSSGKPTRLQAVAELDIYETFTISSILVFFTLSCYSIAVRSESGAGALRSISLVLIFAAILLGVARQRFSWSGAVSRIGAIGSMVIVLLSMLATDSTNRYPDLWSGFGFIATLATLGATVYVKSALSRKLRFQKTLAAWGPRIVLLFYVPVFIQPPYGLLNLGDTTYHVLDEMLAPMVGRFPYFDYSPQYTALFGWPLWPLQFLPVSPATKMVAVIVACNIFLALIPLFAVLTVRMVLPRVNTIVLTLGIVSVWCVSGPYNGSSTQLKEFVTFGRYLPFVLVIWLFSRTLSKDISARTTRDVVVAGGMLGIAVVNNLETGAVISCAIVGASIVPVIRNNLSIFWAVKAIAAAFTVVVLYFGVGIALHGFPAWESFVGIRLVWSSLYEFSRLENFGPHVIVLSVSVTALAIGVRQQLQVPRGNPMTFPAWLQIVCGMSTLLLFTKYFFRPIPQSVPQFFIPAIMSAMVLFADRKVDTHNSGNGRVKLNTKTLPLLFVACIPIGAITQIPNPLDETVRIFEDHSGETDWSSSPGRPVDGWTIASINRTYDNLFEQVNELALESSFSLGAVMYFGMHGNAVELVTGVKNGLGIPAPESLRFGGNQNRLACVLIDEKNPNYVIVYRTTFPCAGYQLVANQSTDSPFKVMMLQR